MILLCGALGLINITQCNDFYTQSVMAGERQFKNNFANLEKKFESYYFSLNCCGVIRVRFVATNTRPDNDDDEKKLRSKIMLRINQI